MQSQHNFLQYPDFIWWMGAVVDRKDPKQIGRVKVRLYGYQNAGIPEERLFWAPVIQPTTSAAISGVGTTPVGLVEGSTVFGFFADGNGFQHPIVLGSLPGIQKEASSKEEEQYTDPNGKYPKYEEDESDCNRLGRGEEKETNIEKKREGVEESVPVALSSETWDEKETEYGAQYPFNHVYESESGHVVEFDDTEEVERISIWHKSGTFVEIHPKGETVIKIKKDRYEINEENIFLLTKKDKKETILENSSLLISKSFFTEIGDDKETEIGSNSSIKIGADRLLEISNDSTVKIGNDESVEITGNSSTSIEGDKEVKVKGGYTIKVEGDMTIEASGLLHLIGNPLKLN